MTNNTNIARRSFIKSTGLVVMAAGLTGNTAGSTTVKTDITIQNVIDRIINTCTGKPLKNTVDTVKNGDTGQAVRGIAVTFLATCDIIEQAIEKNCNFIITHEPTYYNHKDETDWCKNDPVYLHKLKMLESNNIVVWRCHDYIHAHKPDGIIEGMKSQLGWNDYQDPEAESLFHLPALTIKELAEQLQNLYSLPVIKFIGNPDLKCSKTGLVVGASGGTTQLSFMQKHRPDVIICGEINEWITNIYVKDSIHSGRDCAIIVLGHAFSEEAGMDTIVNWLNDWYPQLPVHHIADKTPFQYIQAR